MIDLLLSTSVQSRLWLEIGFERWERKFPTYLSSWAISFSNLEIIWLHAFLRFIYLLSCFVRSEMSCEESDVESWEHLYDNLDKFVSVSSTTANSSITSWCSRPSSNHERNYSLLSLYQIMPIWFQLQPSLMATRVLNEKTSWEIVQSRPMRIGRRLRWPSTSIVLFKRCKNRRAFEMSSLALAHQSVESQNEPLFCVLWTLGTLLRCEKSLKDDLFPRQTNIIADTIASVF